MLAESNYLKSYMKDKYSQMTLEVFFNNHWTLMIHKCRTDKGLFQMLRRDIKNGAYHGYRFITVHSEHMGIPPANR